ncbi:MAG: hypothetical protein WCK29_00540 [archaeon]
MEDINNLSELEKKLGVDMGDMVMCVYEPKFRLEGNVINFATGIYNPFQGINGGSLGPGHVDLMARVQQTKKLERSDKYFRLHLIGQGYVGKDNLFNLDIGHVQIPVESVIDFRVVMKAKDVAEFYKKASK